MDEVTTVVNNTYGYFIAGALLVGFAWFLYGRYQDSKKNKGKGGSGGGGGSGKPPVHRH